MGFILVPKQVDVSNPSKKCEYTTGEPKIPLKFGTHLIGRDKFLHCDDKRMSRQHAKLEVTNDLVTFVGLHKNPCFYLQNGGKIQKLEQNKAVHLQSGDMFGLLPNKCWYEVLHVPDDVIADQTLSGTKQDSDTLDDDDSNKTAMLDSTEVTNDNDDFKALKLLCDAETRLPDNDEGRPSSPNISDQSQSLLQDVPSTISDPSVDQNNQATEKNTSEQVTPVKVKAEKADPVQPSPLKRPFPDTFEVKTEPRDDVAKKIKSEPDGAIPGSSNGQNGVIRDRLELRLSSTETTCSTNDIIDKINSHLSNLVPTDRWDLAAKSWAYVLKTLPKDQQIFAEKLINDVLFEAQLLSLCRQSHVVARLPETTIDLTDL